MTTERDSRTRIVLSWLREDAHENAERVLLLALDEVDATPQRRSWRPAWRTDRMNAFAKTIAAAAAVLLVAVAGYQFLPGRAGSGGPNAMPSTPRLPLLARGVFRIAGSPVLLEAVAQGPSVSGRMFGTGPGGEGRGVDLRCTRTTEDGLIMIGGYTEEQDPVAIVLERGSPVRAAIWSPGSGREAQAAGCQSLLDELVVDRSAGRVRLEPIDGFVELGLDVPPPAGLPLLARGDFVIEQGAVEVEATGEGSTVTGRMTLSDGDPGFTVDLQCARTTDDGWVLIGGYTTEGNASSPVATLAAIAFKRGSPVEATVWAQRGGPTSSAGSCLAYLDEQLQQERTGNRYGDWTSPIEGTVELGQ